MTPIFFMFIFLCVTSGCLKKLATPINSNLKRNFSFKTGSYWIYKDSLSHHTDSFWVNSSTTSPYAADGETYNEEIDQIFCNDNDTIDYNWNLYKNNVSFVYYEGPQTASYLLFSYPFHGIGPQYSDNGTKSNIVNVFTPYSIDSNHFDQVTEINISDSSHFNDWFYVAEKAGIVKMRINHHYQNAAGDTIAVKRVWELMRYRIAY